MTMNIDMGMPEVNWHSSYGVTRQDVIHHTWFESSRICLEHSNRTSAL